MTIQTLSLVAFELSQGHRWFAGRGCHILMRSPFAVVNPSQSRRLGCGAFNASCSKNFSKFHEPFNFLKSTVRVRCERTVVPRFGVRGKLDKPVRAGPVLRRMHERASDAAFARERFDVPTFDMRHGLRVAAVGECTQCELEKSERRRVVF